MPPLFTPRRLLALTFLLVISFVLLRQPASSVSTTSVRRQWNCTSAPDGSRKKRVAVIGAGSAGSSAAYYLREFGGRCYDIDIDVFERNDYIGGRSTTVNPYNNQSFTAELGASIFVEVNYNLVNAAKRFGLSGESFSKFANEDGDRFGVWDGSKFVFVQPTNESYWRTVIRMLWKYGLSPVRTQALMKKTVGSFLKMYDEPIFPFASLSHAVLEVGLLNVTTQTGGHLLEANNISPPFSTDLIQASTRVNYAQNLDQIHGVETMVCMATDGAMSIEGGNWRIFDAMLTHSDAHIHLSTAAHSVSDSEGEAGGYDVKIADARDASLTRTSHYDDVILAAPYQFSDLTLPKSLGRTPDPIDYVKLHVTLFTSPYRLQPEYFGLKSASEIPGTILTTLPNPNQSSSNAAKQGSSDSSDRKGLHDFFSVSTLDKIVNPHSEQDEYLYKIFSSAPVPASLLQHLLLGLEVPPYDKNLSEEEDRHGKPPSAFGKDGVTTWKFEKVWHSYPYLPPRVTFEEPELAPGLWYTAGIESFISTMETSSLMGMNVARLAVERWQRKQSADKSKDNGTVDVDGHDQDDAAGADAAQELK